MPLVRSCSFYWMLKLFTRYFRPRAPELPVSTLDLDAVDGEAVQHRFSRSHSSLGTEHEQLVAQSPPTPQIPYSESPEITFATPPLIQMSPPILSSPTLFTEALPQPGLGQRRGFRGAPLSTPTISFLSLSSALSPLSPHPSPSTPRTPLATVTNFLRPAHGLLAKPRTPAVPEPPVPEELQQYYEIGNPFSLVAESFYIPEALCASLPFSYLQRVDVYRAVAPRALPTRRAVDSVSLSTRGTHVYDLMVYNFQPMDKANKVGNKTRLPLKSRARLLNSTAACLRFPDEEPRVCLPRDLCRSCEVSAEQVELDWVPSDFAQTSREWP
ncbi:hypothetical protein FB45DRAFT_913066 [Roridomyces roridus]|uniref:Uncharacterized protein n=1 Tax=Roridomyces roridus TaxID=1738132 RepID=A0AAD7BWU2_9AGAR|nr:hypothetical protein FB45DRAFT_913066 [Roridomyces roridus]